MVMSSLVTIPATFGEGFTGIAIGLPAAILTTILIILALKNQLILEDQNQQLESTVTKKKKIALQKNWLRLQHL